MIPEQYWQVARRWLWLIVACIVLGGVAALVVLPTFLGSASSYNTKISQTVSHYTSSTRVVTVGEPDSDADTVIADYTDALAAYAQSPQFTAGVSARLAFTGVAMTPEQVAEKLKVTSDRNLFRINMEVTSSSRTRAEAIVTAATDALVAKAAGDEAAVADGLVLRLQQQREGLATRLAALEAEQALVDAGRPPREPQLILLESRAVTAELDGKTQQYETLLLNSNSGGPLTTVGPPDTVETKDTPIPMRDLLLLGAAAGLILGWILANLADRLRYGGRPPQPSVVVISGEAIAANPRMNALLDRVADVEKRARALREAGPDTPHGPNA